MSAIDLATHIRNTITTPPTMPHVSLFTITQVGTTITMSDGTGEWTIKVEHSNFLTQRRDDLAAKTGP